MNTRAELAAQCKAGAEALRPERERLQAECDRIKREAAEAHAAFVAVDNQYQAFMNAFWSLDNG